MSWGDHDGELIRKKLNVAGRPKTKSEPLKLLKPDFEKLALQIYPKDWYNIPAKRVAAVRGMEKLWEELMKS